MANELRAFQGGSLLPEVWDLAGSNFIHHVINKFTQYNGTTSGFDREIYSSSEINGLEILNIDKVTYAGDFENVSG